LTEVGGETVIGIGYPPTLALIKKAGRPVTLRFTLGGTVAAVAPVATAPPDPTEGLTGAAAQKALQDHIMKSGTGDVKKIDRLHRASLQADTGGAGGAGAQSAQASDEPEPEPEPELELQVCR
jgi:hypothetical protein